MTRRCHAPARAFALLAIAALVAVGGQFAPLTTAHAQEAIPAPKKTPTAADLAEARRLFRSAARAYDGGRFDVAVRAFDQAYELAPRASLRFSAAQALRRLYAIDPDPAHLQKALRYYRQYLGEVKDGRRVKDAAEAVTEVEVTLAKVAPEPAEGEEPADPPTPSAPPLGTLDLNSAPPGAVARVAGRKDAIQLPTWIDLPAGEYEVTVEARGFLPMTRKVRLMTDRVTVVDASLAEKPAVLELIGDPACDVVIDGKAAGRTPLVAPLTLPSGTHRIAVGKDGWQVFATTITLRRGEQKRLTIDLGMTAQRGVAWGFFSTAAAATATGIVFAALVAGDRGDALLIERRRDDEHRDLTLAEAQAHNDFLDSAQNFTGLAAASFATAVVTGGLGLTLFVLDKPDLYEATRVDEGDTTAGPLARRSPRTERRIVATPLLPIPGGATVVGLQINARF